MATVIGTTLKDRYQIEARLGEGGAAEVYRALDTRLSRTVVVKVLRPQLAANPDVLKRFEREARDAASLSHPNIVQVFDIENDGASDFIVMEYCDGGDLKRYLQGHGGRLPVARAVEVTQALLRALDYAHQHNVIHRDVKPHNVMLCGARGKEFQSVKLADFGIARALSSDTQTQTGTFVGSAAYISPEQAQGFRVDPASDLYSVGVVLFEMLTGRLPFDADNPVTMALKHVQEPPPSPRALRPDLPPRLEFVLLRALAKDPRQRYQSAAEFAQALANAVGDLIPSASASPLVSSSSGGSGSTPWILLTLLVVVGIAVMVGWQYINIVEVPALIGQSQAQARALLDGKGLNMRIEEAPYNKDVAPGTIVDQKPPSGTRMHAGNWVSVWVSRGNQEVEVPRVQGLSVQDARELIESKGLKVTVREENSATLAEGLVLDETPAAGSVVHLATIVDLVVSKGPALVAVPDLKGKPEEVARKALEQIGLQMEVLDPVSDPTVPKGAVVQVRPAPGSMMKPDGTVQVVLSLGPPRYVVPDLVGLTWGAAQGKCNDAGFHLQLEGAASAIPDDVIVSQSPAPDTRVNVAVVNAQIKRVNSTPIDTPTISIPVNALTMPYLVGNTEEEARSVLAEKGLTIAQIEHRDSDKPAGVVIQTFPEPGTSVQAGQSVTLTVSTGPSTGAPDQP